MKKLLEPGRIGNLAIKNRTVMAPMFAKGMTSHSEQKGISQRGVDYYSARAKGGVGLIITGVTSPNEKMESSWGWPLISDSNAILWLNELADAVHDYGAKIAVQYSAGFGRQQPPDPNLPHGGTVAPSPVPNLFDPSILCRQLTTEEIEEFVKDFGQGARFIKEAGIDAIEIHAHQGYLLDQFMTARTNWRTDKYGGSFDNRIRIIIELLHAVKSEADPDFPVIFRYGLTHHLEREEEYKGARDIEEGLKIARLLEAEGFDALHIDAGVYESNNWAQPAQAQPEGVLAYLAELAKKEVSIPIIAVGKLGNPELAEQTLQDGKADFIALGRPLLADPEWTNKVKQDRLEDIRPCIGCNDVCLGRINSNKYLSCSVNPQTGNERYLAITPADTKKNVVIVGGGPGGMEAARVSAIRGHRVTLIEKAGELGGKLLAAGVLPFKVEYKRYRDYLVTQLKKLGVTTRTDTEATSELILSMEPDVVFIATGSDAILPDIPGVDKKEVITAIGLLAKNPEVGDKVVVIGGSTVGAETALYLARQGKSVVIVEESDEIMQDSFWIEALDIKKRFDGLEDDQIDVTVLTKTNALEIVEGGVVVRQNNETSTLKADTVVLAVGMKPSEVGLMSALEGKISEVYQIGDCGGGKKVKDAVWGGFRIARHI